jgi:hypothetical protein
MQVPPLSHWAPPRIFPLVISKPLTTYVGILVDEVLATHYEVLARWVDFVGPMQIPFAQLCLSTIKHWMFRFLHILNPT